jgi:hypothetical protein
MPTGKSGPQVFADARDDLRHHARSVFKAAAVFVGALVRIGREELLQQIPVRAVELDAVAAGLLHARGARDELADQFLHFIGRERAGGLLAHLAGDVGRGDDRLAADERGHALAAGMVQLDEDFAVLGVDGRGQRLSGSMFRSCETESWRSMPAPCTSFTRVISGITRPAPPSARAA